MFPELKVALVYSKQADDKAIFLNRTPKLQVLHYLDSEFDRNGMEIVNSMKVYIGYVPDNTRELIENPQSSLRRLEVVLRDTDEATKTFHEILTALHLQLEVLVIRINYYSSKNFDVVKGLVTEQRLVFPKLKRIV